MGVGMDNPIISGILAIISALGVGGLGLNFNQLLQAAKARRQAKESADCGFQKVECEQRKTNSALRKMDKRLAAIEQVLAELNVLQTENEALKQTVAELEKQTGKSAI